MPMPIAVGNRYNFVSPGAMVGDQMSDLLAQRELERQKDLENQRAQQELTLRQAAEARLAKVQEAQVENAKANTASLTDERNATAQDREQKTLMGILHTGGVGSEVSADTVARATKAGLSPALFGTQVTQGAHTSTDENGVPQYATSSKTTYKGTPEEKQFQQFLDDPDVPANAKAFARATGDLKGAAALLKGPETEDVFYQDPRTKKVLRRDPATNQFEEFHGDVPKGAHWMTEPSPLNTPNQQFNQNNASYQYHMTQIDKIGTPLSQNLDRFARLSDTVTMATPQADALVAPELLTVMAGGQGSGVRMNEAEIYRILGGRSGFENIKAALQHWNPNSGQALSITTEQRKEIKDLMGEVSKRLQQKIDALDEAGDTLVQNFDNPAAHRTAYDKAKKKIHDIDFGTINTNNDGADKSKSTDTAPTGEWIDLGNGVKVRKATK